MGIFQKGKIRRDFATREIQIKVHVTCLTPPNPFATLPKRAVKSSISQKKITMLQMNIYDFHEALTLPVYPQLRQSHLEF